MIAFALDSVILACVTGVAYLVGRSDGREAMDRENAAEIRRLYGRTSR